MPPSQPPKSLQEILRQRQQSEFVGRDDYLNAFSHNLKVPLDDNQRRFLFNAWGQGGVGKSTLLKQFSKSAQDAKAAVAYTDEGQTSVAEALGRLAEQFTQQGYKLNQFTENYRLYRQRKQELETDPEAPQGFSAFVGKTMVKAGVKLGRRVPVGGAVLDFVDEDTLSTQAGEWASYVVKKLRNKDEVQLIQEPVAVLTPLFLQDLCTLAQQACVALFFDTYEQTDEFLDDWLRDVLEGKHGDVPSNIVITIAGRHPLADNHWATYDGLIARFPLEPFTEEEAKQYLHRKGITNPKVVEVILHLSGKLPLLVAMLAVGSPDDPDQVGDPSDTAVERFLKWVEDPKQRQVALAAALPRKFNRDIIAELTNEDDADTLFAWLKTMPFVKEQRDGWVHHQVVRAQMLRYQRLTSPKSWEAAQTKLKHYFDQHRSALALEDDKQECDPDWQHYSLEVLYHSLCATPKKQLKPAINGFLAALKTKRFFALQWAEVMDQAGQDVEGDNLIDWSLHFLKGLRAYDDDEYAITIEMFSKLLDSLALEPRWQCVALAWRGYTYRLMDANEDALKDLNKALDIDSSNEWVIACRGLIYGLMERYEEALADLTLAIELKPDDEWAITNRGVTYRLVERYEKSLADLTRAIKLQPDAEGTIANRGVTYRQMECYEKALADLTRAIELDPKYTWAIASRGLTYRQIERHEDALADLSRAIELDPKYEWAFTERGLIYQALENYQAALADFQKAVELNPRNSWNVGQRGEQQLLLGNPNEALADFNYSLSLKESDWTFYERGLAHRKLNQSILAQADFQKAIQLVQQGLKTQPDIIQDIFNLALYCLANSQLDLSKQTYRQALNHKITRARICEAVQDLKEFITLFPGHPQATAFYNGLRKKLELSP